MLEIPSLDELARMSDPQSAPQQLHAVGKPAAASARTKPRKRLAKRSQSPTPTPKRTAKKARAEATSEAEQPQVTRVVAEPVLVCKRTYSAGIFHNVEYFLYVQGTGVQVVQSLTEAEKLCEQAVDRWFERRAVTSTESQGTRHIEAVFDEALERSVAARFALRVVRDRCKTTAFPLAVNVIAGLTAFAIANTLKY
jgi:hypothetical protein